MRKQSNSHGYKTLFKLAKKYSVATILAMSVASMLFFSALSRIHTFFTLPMLFVIILTIAVLAAKRKDGKKLADDNTPKTITDAQVKTVLRMTSNRLTIRELAAKTNSSITLAESKLKEMYLDGKLEMDERDGVIIYYNVKKLN